MQPCHDLLVDFRQQGMPAKCTAVAPRQQAEQPIRDDRSIHSEGSARRLDFHSEKLFLPCQQLRSTFPSGSAATREDQRG